MKVTLEALKAIKDDFKANEEGILLGFPQKYISPRFGICRALRSAGGCLDLLYPYFKTWEHYSGHINYPVGNGKPDYFSKYSNLWVGEIGQLRLNLLDHLIVEMEKDL